MSLHFKLLCCKLSTMGLYLELKQTETKTTELCMVSLKRTEEDFGTRLFTIGRFPFQWLVGGTRQVNWRSREVRLFYGCNLEILEMACLVFRTPYELIVILDVIMTFPNDAYKSNGRTIMLVIFQEWTQTSWASHHLERAVQSQRCRVIKYLLKK